MMTFVDLADPWSNFRLIEVVNAKDKIILGRRHSSPLKKILHFYQPPPPHTGLESSTPLKKQSIMFSFQNP